MISSFFETPTSFRSLSSTGVHIPPTLFTMQVSPSRKGRRCSPITMPCSTMKIGNRYKIWKEAVRNWTIRKALFQVDALNCVHVVHLSRKIGKFGMGFRSCYHITDTPQILSCSELAMLDPQKLTFAEGGVKYDFVNDASHADQLSGFDSFISVKERSKPFRGTIIRLPLRSAPSSIRDTVVNATEIRELLVEFIKAEIDAALLFLSHITSIEVYETNDEGRRRLIKIKKRVADRLDYEIPHANICATSIIKTHKCSVAVESSEAVASCTTWRVLFSSHAPDISHRILSDRLKFNQDSTDLRNRLGSEKLLPRVGLAIPLSPQPAPRQGRLYTFLPLPLITGFPMHVHGLFALDSARRHLRGDVDAVNPQSTDKSVMSITSPLFNLFNFVFLFTEFVQSGIVFCLIHSFLLHGHIVFHDSSRMALIISTKHGLPKSEMP
jgi:hypothetical protein